MGNVAQLPRPTKCHECGHEAAVAVCPLCLTERPAYAALKRITAKAHHGVAPLRAPNACRYYPDSICGCNGRGECLSAA